MAVDVPEPEDTEMNMTPMIDIVFQLIIFFMLTMKFKEIDRRIDSQLPKDRGMAATSDFPEEFEKIKIKVFRRNLKEAESEQYTLIKVDNTHEFKLPKNWKGFANASPEQAAAYSAVIEKVYSVVMGKLRAHPGNKDEVKGEIVAPPPKGGAVPHGDVMQILDVFLRAKITDVMFEGKATPLTSRERAQLQGGG